MTTPRPKDHSAHNLPLVPPELADFLAAVGGPAWEATDAFRESLCSYVGALKANGAPPERVLAIVKPLLGHKLRPSLAEQVVKLCIEAYFRPD